MKPVTKLILAAITMILVIGFVVVWDLYIKENIESQEVVVLSPSSTLHEYDKIRRSDLIVENRNRATLVEGYVKPEELNSLIGKEANQTIVGNQIISKRYVDFETFEPNPNNGESIRPVPNQWIYAMPATLRRKDQIDIYLVKRESEKVNEQNQEEQQTNQNELVGLSPEQEIANQKVEDNNIQEDITYLEERSEIAEDKGEEIKKSAVLSETKQNVAGEEDDILAYQNERNTWLKTKGLTEEVWGELAQKGDIPVLVDVPVAYAKDGSGNEIQSNPEGETTAKPTSEEEARLLSTGAITNLEIILTEDHHRLLMSYINQGYQLYITYN